MDSIGNIPLQRFTELFSRQTGMKVPDYQFDQLRETLKRLIEEHQLNHAGHLLERLRATPQHASTSPNPLMQQLINALTIGESKFFRDAERIRFLQQFLLPQLLAQKKCQSDTRIKILSAGCAQGQELYTLAMMLNSMLDDKTPWQLDLIGIDINTDEIAAAKTARYTPWSLRSIPALYRQQYFDQQQTPQGMIYQLHDKIKQNTRFLPLNLQTDALSSGQHNIVSVDLILCCNVFIYFDLQHMPNILSGMANSLTTNGTLVLAAADYDSHMMNKHFEQRFFDHYSYFVKRNGPLPASISTTPVVVIGQKTPTKRPSEQNTNSPRSTITTDGRVDQLMQQGQWSEAITTINHWLHTHPQQLHSQPLLRMQANALANIGDLNGVIAVCTPALQRYPKDKILYLISALAYAGLNQLADAQRALHQALFLDPQFIDAHYHQALLAVKQGHNKQAHGCLQTALRLCQQRPDEEMTCLYPQTRIKVFRDTLVQELAD